MPGEIEEPEGPLSEAEYLLSRMLCGCPSFISEGGWVDADDAWTRGVHWGEWTPSGGVQTMPVGVISTNQFSADADGPCEDFQSSGALAIVFYIAAKLRDDLYQAQFHASDFFGKIIRELFDQKDGLNSPGDFVSDKCLELRRIEVLGPTRTPKDERAPDGSNDYWDAVFLIQWGGDS